MKTTLYLRLSLLIPILVWGVCLLILIVASASPTNDLGPAHSMTIPNLIFLFFAFYVFGIIVWVFPYLLLSLILLALRFMAQGQATIKVFALSPIPMTILTMLSVNLLAMEASGDGMILSNPFVKDQNFIGFNILALLLSLIWGYICVGMGFGIYKLLKQRHLIKDEVHIESKLRSINPYG
jgi:hypothetical protein